MADAQYSAYMDMKIERDALRTRCETLEAALRGVQGIEFEDGYHVNVADLKSRCEALEARLAEVVAAMQRVRKAYWQRLHGQEATDLDDAVLGLGEIINNPKDSWPVAEWTALRAEHEAVKDVVTMCLARTESWEIDEIASPSVAKLARAHAAVEAARKPACVNK